MNTIKRFDSFINEQKTTGIINKKPGDILVNSGFEIIPSTNKKKTNEIISVMNYFEQIKGGNEPKIDLGTSPVFYVFNDGDNLEKANPYSVIKGSKYVYVLETHNDSKEYYKAKSLKSALDWIKDRQAYRELMYLKKPTNKKYLKGVVGANESINI